ncbi:DUF1634 domain-containing protein [Occallatibacter savannae]|uniref:DUF1634 domain-containing protein n=1 Tax=Occallatibacter savannae TaxID=1002691 RepID=UPI0013A5A087|nr:DUF1634 domain-containing protein [Occallatibacter savannae]
MGRLLQVGVLLASFVMIAGGFLYMHAHSGEKPNYRVFSSEPQRLRHFSGVIDGIKTGDPAALIQLAVLLLIATPVARVVFALIAFVIERDKLFVLISAIVLGVLLYGFLRPR